MERTFVAIKPDGVDKGIVGDIISRFEKAGLSITMLEMVDVSKELADKHYPADRREFIEGMGSKTLANYKDLEIDAKKELGTDDPHEIGLLVRSWLVDFITSGKVVAMVLEGHHAIEVVRKIVGHTLPLQAAPGTIRGDHALDSPSVANPEKRPVKNLIHASSNSAEAEYEISLWFDK